MPHKPTCLFSLELLPLHPSITAPSRRFPPVNLCSGCHYFSFLQPCYTSARSLVVAFLPSSLPICNHIYIWDLLGRGAADVSRRCLFVTSERSERINGCCCGPGSGPPSRRHLSLMKSVHPCRPCRSRPHLPMMCISLLRSQAEFRSSCSFNK